MSTNALTELKRDNKAALLYKLMSSGATSRVRLAHELKLTSAAVTILMQELILEGAVRESREIVNGRPGRKEIALEFAADRYAAIGVNIESDNTHVSACTFGSVIREDIYPTAQLFRDGNVLKLGKIIADIRAYAGVELCGISVGISGAVNEAEGVSENSYGILPKDYPLGKELEKLLGEPVDVINNVKAQARSLITERNDNFLYVKHSPGIGCAIVANEKTVGGAGSKAGELGHTIVNPYGLPCRCGKRGCLEAYVSEYRICEFYETKTGFKLPINEIYKRYGCDKAADEILNEAIEYVALSLGNSAAMFDPKALLVTGGMFMNDNLFAAVNDRLFAMGFGRKAERIGNDRKIKSFAEVKHLILKKVFGV